MSAFAPPGDLPARHGFRAMGTSVELLGPAGHLSFTTAADAVTERFRREEMRFSRFRDDSELHRVNTSAGAWTPASTTFLEVVALALDAARRTEGRVDPTVLAAVVAAGYDRDFDDLVAGARSVLRPAPRCGRWRAVERRPGEIRLPRGVGLDLGGIAKGWTVDRAAGDAVAAGLPWALVNAGGDLRLLNPVGAGAALEISIEDPDASDRELLRLRLSSGALATSSTSRRSWGPGLHHLIDPGTGRPAATGIVQATAWAPTCVDAEVLAKDIVLRGERVPATPAVVVDDGDEVSVTFPEGAAA